jgi:large subunit ribosomal protein L10
MNRKEKEQAVADLKQRFSKAQAAILAEYKGLTVAELTALRRELREISGEYQVAKNTLVELAIEGSPFFSVKDLLNGQNGLIFGYGDAIGLAKIVFRYAREHDKFIIKGGAVEGQFLAAANIEALAQLPNRETLRAQLLAVLSRLATQLVGTLAAPASQIAYVLEARRSQLPTL